MIWVEVRLIIGRELFSILIFLDLMIITIAVAIVTTTTIINMGSMVIRFILRRIAFLQGFVFRTHFIRDDCYV